MSTLPPMAYLGAESRDHGDGNRPPSPFMTRSSTSARGQAPGAAATILDVARRAGVSTATVSRALAAPDRVAEETRARR